MCSRLLYNILLLVKSVVLCKCKGAAMFTAILYCIFIIIIAGICDITELHQIPQCRRPLQYMYILTTYGIIDIKKKKKIYYCLRDRHDDFPGRGFRSTSPKNHYIRECLRKHILHTYIYIHCKTNINAVLQLFIILLYIYVHIGMYRI